jgi:hypothetical protein
MSSSLTGGVKLAMTFWYIDNALVQGLDDKINNSSTGLVKKTKNKTKNKSSYI